MHRGSVLSSLPRYIPPLTRRNAAHVHKGGRVMNRLFAAGCVLALGLLAPAYAEDDKKDKDNPAAKPAERLKQKGWADRHKLFLKRNEDSKNAGDVIFLGDSITHGWEGQKAW